MTKIVYKSLKDFKPNKKDTSVTVRRVRNAAGGRTTVYVVDADSDTFGADLTYAFQQNVTKARRHNKRLLGHADRAPADG